MRATVLGGGIAGRSLARLACSETAGPSHSTNRKIMRLRAVCRNERRHSRQPIRRMPLAIECLPTDDAIRFAFARLADRDRRRNKPSSPGSTPSHRPSTGERNTMPQRLRPRARRLNQPCQIDSGPSCFRNRVLWRPHTVYPRPRHSLGQRMATARPPTLFGRRTPTRAIGTRKQLAALASHISRRKRNPRRRDKIHRRQHRADQAPAKRTTNQAVGHKTHRTPRVGRL